MSQKDRLELPPLKLDWDEGRTERLLASVHGRIDRRKRTWRAAAVATTIATVIGMVLFAQRAPRSTATATPRAIEAPLPIAALSRQIVLTDGSKIDVDPATSEVRVVEDGPASVRVDALRGWSRYDVVPNAERAFEVRAGAVTVTVVGTEFIVERRGEKTWVEVVRGKVRVAWGDDRAFLAAGESGAFPRDGAPSAAPAPVPSAGEGEAPIARGAHAKQMYRSQVARHDYRGAYAVLSKNPALAGDTVEELLIAADVARLSNHPPEAIPYLQRVIREHPRDERAPLAAFTLGRTFSGLGRNEEAMNMFGRVRSSWPKSPLAEDALLRQGEAASQLGDLATARRVAEQYDRDYPNGRRRAEVRRFARMD
jgi:transmembrane sensor